MRPMSDTKPGLRRTLFNRRMLICVFTGFSSGLPLYLLINLLPAWLRSEAVDLRSIGMFALIQFPFTWKFLWAPLLDRYAPPFLGRRRGWMLAMQLLLLVSIPLFGALRPQLDLWTIAYLAAAVAFFAATQDIALDAYRRELLPDAELGLGNSIHVQAYRVRASCPAHWRWCWPTTFPGRAVFVVTALFMLPGVVNTLLVSEPALARPAPRTLDRGGRRAVPRVHQPRRLAVRRLLVLAFIFFYKLGDSMATALATPFYLDMGFSKSDIGLIAKNAGLWASVVGGLLGGIWMLKIGINRGLWLFGVVQVLSILGFAWLAYVHEPDRLLLAAVIAFEALGVGLGTAAFIAFIARDNRPALYGDAVRPVHQPCLGTPRAWSMRRPAGWSRKPAGSPFSCYARRWRSRAWRCCSRSRHGTSRRRAARRACSESGQIQRYRAPRSRLLQSDCRRQDRAHARSPAAAERRRRCSTWAVAAASWRCASSSASRRRSPPSIVSSPMLDAARERAQWCGALTRLRLVQADIAEYRPEAAPFDLTVMLGSWGHSGRLCWHLRAGSRSGLARAAMF